MGRLRTTHCLVIPDSQACPVSQQVHVPIQALKMAWNADAFDKNRNSEKSHPIYESDILTYKGVVDVARCAVPVVRGPVLVVQPHILPKNIVHKLGKPRVFPIWPSDFLLPIVHHYFPAVLVIVVIVWPPSLHTRILQLVSESTEEPLEWMPDKDDGSSWSQVRPPSLPSPLEVKSG